LTEGVKNMVRGLLPDPVEDPWLYKLVPQKIYDWLGVPTAVREAEAEMAEAGQEKQKLEQDRNDLAKKVAASKLWVETGGEQGQDFSTNIMGSKVGEEEEWQRDQANKIEKLDAEILEATKKQETIATVLEQAQAGGTIPLAVALYSKEGKDLGIKSTAEAAKALQRAAPQDFDATATISTTGTPGGAAPVIVNNVSNNTSGGSTSAPTNNYLNITANATDPYTSKQPNLAYKRY
jgi:hypothetical protein